MSYKCDFRNHQGIERLIQKLGMAQPLMPDPELGQDVAFLANVITEQGKQLLDLRKVVEGCKDVLAQFLGNSAPIIAHPPSCGFYAHGLNADCNCTARSTANDVMLSFQACRAILDGKVLKVNRVCELCHRGTNPEVETCNRESCLCPCHLKRSHAHDSDKT